MIGTVIAVMATPTTMSDETQQEEIRMIKRIRSKLRSKAGESIAETLIATLIAALALVMLAGAISAAANMVTTSKTAVKRFYATEENDRTGVPEDSPIVQEIEKSLSSIQAEP